MALKAVFMPMSRHTHKLRKVRFVSTLCLSKGKVSGNHTNLVFSLRRITKVCAHNKVERFIRPKCLSKHLCLSKLLIIKEGIICFTKHFI